jgi:hypothetical protein
MVLAAQSLNAQTPDSITAPLPFEITPGDTVEVPIPPGVVSSDTVPTELREAAQQLRPAPVLPDFPAPSPVGWSAARWRWDRSELLMIPGLTLLDLVERLPGFVAFRTGEFGRPLALTTPGSGGGRLRIFIDGYELDPFDAASYPLEAVPLADLSEITVERTLSEVRVEVVSFQLTDPQPYSEVQLGTGAFQTRMLRALFSRGFGRRSVATGSLDLLQTEGHGYVEPYASRNVNLRWATIPSERGGVQLEFRSTKIDRRESVFPLETTRKDLALRGRRLLGERTTVEGIVGHTRVSGVRSFLIPDTASIGSIVEVEAPERSDIQAVGRLAYSGERMLVRGSAQSRYALRDEPVIMPLEARTSVAFRPVSSLWLEAEAIVQSSETTSAGGFRLGGSLNPLPKFTVFGSIEGGSRLNVVRYLPGTMISDPLGPFLSDTVSLVFSRERANATGYRAGVELAGFSGRAGGAIVGRASTRISGFGLPFDIGVAPFDVGPNTALEMYFDTRLFSALPALRVDGWYNHPLEGEASPYVPNGLGRFGISLHDQFYGGQLEPRLRLELVRQGRVTVPLPEFAEGEVSVPEIQTMNLEFRLRILDVQAFLIWNNLLLDDISLPVQSAPPPRPRLIYGASWRFHN